MYCSSSRARAAREMAAEGPCVALAGSLLAAVRGNVHRAKRAVLRQSAMAGGDAEERLAAGLRLDQGKHSHGRNLCLEPSLCEASRRRYRGIPRHRRAQQACGCQQGFQRGDDVPGVARCRSLERAGQRGKRVVQLSIGGFRAPAAAVRRELGGSGSEGRFGAGLSVCERDTSSLPYPLMRQGRCDFRYRFDSRTRGLALERSYVQKALALGWAPG